jgi:hypothetical protein
MDTATYRFPIKFDAWYRPLSTVLFLPPSTAYVTAEGGEVHVRMGWAFSARFPRSAVARVARATGKPISRGVHGGFGRWLVNGSGDGLVEITFEPVQRGRVMGVPVRLEKLVVSVDDPDGVIAQLQRS